MIIKNIFKIFFIIAVMIVGAIIFSLLPNYSTKIVYAGEQVFIQRDMNNIPTINAPSRMAFFYAWGVVLAEDRLFQMAFKQLVIQGRLSQFLGEKALDMDKFMRQLNLDQYGQLTANRLQKQNLTQYLYFQAYVDGINYVANSYLIMPNDFQLIRLKWENWTVSSVMSIFKLLEWSQSASLIDQLTRSFLLQSYTIDQINNFLPNTQQLWAFDSTTIVQDREIPDRLKSKIIKMQNEIKQSDNFNPEVLQKIVDLGLFNYLSTVEGSNSWVISGNLTETGKPLLANDPHLQNNIPSQWYQLRGTYRHYGNTFNVAGAVCPGFPVIFGKTNYLAMGITTIYCDTQDLYKQTIQNNQYQVNGIWRDLSIRNETILVKTQEGLKQQIFTVRSTFRGPILTRFMSAFGTYQINQTVSLAWTGFHNQYSSLVVVTHLPEVQNYQTFLHFLSTESKYLFNLNIVFMTIDGHIGYQQLGLYPIRPNNQGGNFVKNGSNTDNDWRGFIPSGDRLQILDPQSGYIVTANNKIASKLYYDGLLQQGIYTARSDRIHEMINTQIESGRKLNINFMKKMLADTIDVYCRQIISDLITVLPQSSLIMTTFNCDFNKNSHQATIYQVFWYELHLLTKPHKSTKMSTLSLHPTYQYLYKYIRQAKQDQSKQIVCSQAWQKTMFNLTGFFKTSIVQHWRWGQYHKDVMHHLPFTAVNLLHGFYDRIFEGYGNMHTVNVGKMNKIQLGNYETSHRANYRVIFSFDNDSQWIIDSGSSQLFFSDHYDDQWQLFQNNEYLAVDVQDLTIDIDL